MTETSSRAARLRALDRAHVWHPYTQMGEYPPAAGAPIIERAQGAWLYDVDGRGYLDGYAQMWTNVWGHAHPELDAAIIEQLGRVAHTSLFSASSVPAIELASRLAGLAAREFETSGERALSRVFLSDNGSTAVEVALKIAIQFHRNRGDTKRTKLLAFSDAYHGDTCATMSLGGVELFRAAYAPLTFEVLQAPYPIRANDFDPADEREASAARAALTALDGIFERHGHELAAAVIEPACQGAGGIRPAWPGYYARLRHLCDAHGVLLAADEVLVAFGRAGAMFASAGEKIVPDLLCLAKGLGAGYLPVAATLASERVYREFLGRREDFRHLLHGHTFGGNQLACAVALRSLDLFEREVLIATIRAHQPFIVERLRNIAKLPGVGRIRHKGMMTGIPLAAETDGVTGYAGSLGQKVCATALERGVILRPLGDVIVLMPVLAMTRSELGELFDVTEAAIAETIESNLRSKPHRKPGAT